MKRIVVIASRLGALLSGVPLICPFAIAVILALVNLSTGWEWCWPDHGRGFYGMGEMRHAVPFCVAALVVVASIGFVADRCAALPTPVVWSGIFAIGFLLRLMPILMSWGQIVPLSDFDVAWHRACGDPYPVDNHWICYSWMNYAAVLKAFVLAFGCNLSWLLSCFAMAGGVTAVAAAGIAEEVSGSRASAIAAGILFAIYPASLAYAVNGTPEHLSIAFFMTAVWLACRMFRNPAEWRIVGTGSLAGILIGFGEAIKPFAPVIVIALLLTWLLEIPRFAQGRRIRCLAIPFTAFVCMLIAKEAVVIGVTTVAEREFGRKLDRTLCVPHVLIVGLNRQGEGQLHLGPISRCYQNALMAGESKASAAASSWRRLADDWRAHWDALPSFFAKKLVWTWQSDSIPVYYYRRSVPLDNAFARFVARNGDAVTTICYLLIMAMGGIGAIMVSRRESPTLRFVGLILFGFFCLMLISESQSRYKCLVMPCVMVYAAVGLLWMKGRKNEE